MKTLAITFALLALISINCWALLFAVPAINAWEKAHNYPYGRMCDVFHSCRPVR
jgi:hypothetical protein